MDIKIRANKLENATGNTVGLASVDFGGEFVAKSISIMKTKKDTLLVNFPSYPVETTDDKGEKKTEYKPHFCPLNNNEKYPEFAKDLRNMILAAFADGNEKTIQIDAVRPSVSARMSPISNEKFENTRAVGTVYLNDMFAINNVYLNEGKNGMWVKMPAYKSNELGDNGKNVYKDYCYGKTDGIREEIKDACVKAYDKSLEKAAEKANAKEEKSSLVDSLESKTSEANAKAASAPAKEAPAKENNSPQLG